MKKSLKAVITLGSLSLLMTACSANSDNKANDRDAAIAAAIAHDPVVQMTANSKNGAAIQTVEDAYTGMRDVRAARLAIFDGAGPAAKTYVDDATTRLTAAFESAGQQKVYKDGKLVEGAYVPIDVAMAVAEDYSANPAKTAKIAEANGHLANGDQKKAAEVLRLADVNVMTSVALLPVGNSLQLLADATRLLRDGHYYDANLALKALEDSVVVQDYDVDGVPAAKPTVVKAAPTTPVPATAATSKAG